MMDGSFSDQFKEIISRSRELALDLGYDYISSIHFLLADAIIGGPGSILRFAFAGEEELHSFCKAYRIGEPLILMHDLPLTKEAEQVIRKAVRLRNSATYWSAQVEAFHLFLGASLIKSSFRTCFNNSNTLHQELEHFYINTGALRPEQINKSFWKRVKKKYL